MQTVLKLVYSIFIGIILALLIGLGISAFYPAPQMPEPTREDFNKQDEAAITAKLAAYDVATRDYTEQLKKYDHNVAIIVLIASIAVLVISLLLASKILVIADGLLMGSVFSLVYSIIRAFGANDQKFVFIVVVIAFIIALIIGYLKFIRPKSVTA